MLSILQRYVSKSYLSAWFLGMVVLTFVLSIALFVKAAQLVVKGLPVDLVARFVYCSFPESLTFTIPLASLVSALLLFGRLSADGEINAMRACGVNIWRIMIPLVFFGMALTALSVYVNSEVAPTGAAKRHDLLNNTTRSKDLVKLLEPGHFIRDFNGVDLWFESREGDTLKNLLILEKMKNGATRETRCNYADLEVGEGVITLDMHDVRITPFSEDEPGTATVGRLRHTIENANQNRRFKRKVGDLLNTELLSRIERIDSCEDSGDYTEALEDYERQSAELDYATSINRRVDKLSGRRRLEAYAIAAPKVRSELLTELNRRFALGMAPLAFILLGMPLGIRTSRRESNIGIAISLGVMLIYYAFIIATKALANIPSLHPHLIIWTPTVICAVIAAVLIRKNQ